MIQIHFKKDDDFIFDPESELHAILNDIDEEIEKDKENEESELRG